MELGYDATVTGLPWAKFTEQVSSWENTPHATVVSVLANVPDPENLGCSFPPSGWLFLSSTIKFPIRL